MKATYGLPIAAFFLATLCLAAEFKSTEAQKALADYESALNAAKSKSLSE